MPKKATILMRHALHKRACGESIEVWLPLIQEAHKWAMGNFQPRLAAQANNLLNKYGRKALDKSA